MGTASAWLPSRKSTLHQMGARVRTRLGHCRSGKLTGGNGRYFFDGFLCMFVFQLWQRRFRLAKQKPHRRLAWGSINLVNESEPDRRAAQPQRVQQQVQIQIAIHWRNNNRLVSAGQILFLLFKPLLFSVPFHVHLQVGIQQRNEQMHRFVHFGGVFKFALDSSQPSPETLACLCAWKRKISGGSIAASRISASCSRNSFSLSRRRVREYSARAGLRLAG